MPKQEETKPYIYIYTHTPLSPFKLVKISDQV